MNATASLPGFHSPAASFEQPFDMLEACHERVQRSLALLGRIVAHVQAQGHDAQSRSACADVMRYFDVAAPHHHEDEERHVFPLLRQHPDPLVREAVATLQAQHTQMHALWQRLRPRLLAWQSDAAPAIHDADCALIAEFNAVYAQHIPLEESLAYPAAQPLLDGAALQAVGQEMAARRQGAR